jgi:hypothetical protein
LKILIINSDPKKDEQFRNSLRTISEPQELKIFHNIDEAERFITYELEKNQKELDLIITDLFDNYYPSAREFCYSIRYNTKSTYSSNNFKLSSIPIILLFSGRLNNEQYIEYGFDEIINTSFDYYFRTITSTVISVVKKWRNLVFDDLEVLGLGTNQVFNKVNIHIIKSKAEITKILTEDFVMKRKKLDIMWIKPNLFKLEQGIELLDKKIKESENQKKKNEKNFHKIFKNYNELLLRGSFQKNYFYELDFNATVKYKDGIEPDFILKSYYNTQNELEIMEFKTPNEMFYEKDLFHQNLRKKIFKHIGQVKDYKDYLEDIDNEQYLEELLDLSPINFKYNLVIGRKDDFELNKQVYEIRSRQYNLQDVNILTFDDMSNLGKRYFEELNETSIK